jgi:hypothetical protein
LVTFGGVHAVLNATVVEFRRRQEGPGRIARAKSLFFRSEVVITDGPLRGFAKIERRLSAHPRVLPPLQILQRQTRLESPEQWIRQA